MIVQGEDARASCAFSSVKRHFTVASDAGDDEFAVGRSNYALGVGAELGIGCAYKHTGKISWAAARLTLATISVHSVTMLGRC